MLALRIMEALRLSRGERLSPVRAFKGLWPPCDGELLMMMVMMKKSRSRSRTARQGATQATGLVAGAPGRRGAGETEGAVWSQSQWDSVSSPHSPAHREGNCAHGDAAATPGRR